MQVEIDQGEVRAEPVMVLRDATIAHPVEAEDAFQDAEHMFYFRSYFRLGCVLSFRFFVHIVFELRPAATSCPARVARPRGWPPSGPDSRRRPTPCALRRAADRAAYACRPPRPRTCIPNAPRPLCCPPRYAPSDRSTTGSPSWSDASPGRARRTGSWWSKARG